MKLEQILNLIPLQADQTTNKAPTRIRLLRDGDIGWANMEGVELDKEQGEAIVKAFDEHGADVPIDYHHSTSAVEDHEVEKAPAAGWIKRLEYIAGDGLYAQVEWSLEAAAEIEARKYKYVSPVILLEKKTKRITEIHSVALTNRPRTINAQELLEAAENLNMATTNDAGATSGTTDNLKAVADLMAALRSAGVAIAEQADLTAVLTAATEFISANSEPATTEEEIEPKKNDEESAAKAAVETLKAASIENMQKRLAELEAERTERVAADKTGRVEKLVGDMVAANKLNPNDAKAMASARVLAEKDEKAFGELFDSIPAYGPTGSQTRGAGSPETGARARLILSASREYDGNKRIGCGAKKRYYVDAALVEEGLSALDAKEVEALQ